MPPPAPHLIDAVEYSRLNAHFNSISSDYNLLVRQQPKQARLCTGTDKQPKGPVDPPPVVRLQISRNDALAGRSASSSPDLNTSKSTASAKSGKLTSASLIQSPYLFCFAALCKAEEDEELYLQPDGKSRYITGNTVSSLYHLRDPKDGSAEGFFVFPDIGVRIEGVFRLKMSLYEMVDATVHHCKTVYTEPFDVYSAKKYPGLEDPTDLSKSFASQGLKMRIKGGPARTAGRSKETSSRPSTSGAEESTAKTDQAVSLKRPYTAETEQRSAIKRRSNADVPFDHQRYLQTSVHGSRPTAYEGYNEPERNSYYDPRQALPPGPSFYRSSQHQEYRIDQRGMHPAPRTHLNHYPRPTTAPAEPSPRFGRDYPPPSPLGMTWPPPPTPVEYYRPGDMGPPRHAPPYHRSQSDHRVSDRLQYSHPPNPEPNAFASGSYARPQHGLPRPYLSRYERPLTAESSSRLTLPPLAEAVSREASPFQEEALRPPEALAGHQAVRSASSSLRSLLNPDPPPRQIDDSLNYCARSPVPSEGAISASEEDARYYENKARQPGSRPSFAG